MKTLVIGTFLILGSISSLHADQLDDLLRDVRAGRRTSVSKEDCATAMKPVLEALRDAHFARYVALVKLSLLNPELFAGWPYRDSDLFEPGNAEGMHEWLFKRFADTGDTIYLYADISPLIVLGRNDDLAKVLSQLESKDKFLAEHASLKNIDEWRRSIAEDIADYKKKHTEQK